MDVCNEAAGRQFAMSLNSTGARWQCYTTRTTPEIILIYVVVQLLLVTRSPCRPTTKLVHAAATGPTWPVSTLSWTLDATRLPWFIIIILKTMFMVLSSWQRHCQSSSGSFDECRTAPSDRWSSGDLGCYCPHPPSPFSIKPPSPLFYPGRRPE